jgi:NAD(P)-dependent dehydrogenase (short-subunit alcohol dehydrogenase family)
MLMRFKEKVAIVSGSASGIGKAIAHRFASEGAFVVIADKNEGAIPPTVDEIEAAGSSAAGFPVDVADRGQVQAFMTKVVAAHGRVDILVNNAGITRYRPFLTMADEDWNLVLDVDLKGVFFSVQAAAPQMIRQAYGKIVNISSALGTGTTPHNTAGSPAGSSAYASAKAGVIQLTKTLARELGRAASANDCATCCRLKESPSCGTASRSGREIKCRNHPCHVGGIICI